MFGEYVRRFDLGAAGVDDFIAIACELAPAEADDIAAIARWFGLVGRPSLRISVDESADAGATRVAIERVDALADDPPVAVPVVVALRDDHGALPSSVGGVVADEHVVVAEMPHRAALIAGLCQRLSSMASRLPPVSVPA